MEIRHASGSPFDAGAELTVVAVTGDPKKDAAFKAADKATGGLLARAATQERFAGKPGQAVHVHASIDGKPRRIAVVGAGDKAALKPASVRDLAAQAVQLGRNAGVASVCFAPPAVAPRLLERALQAAAEGATLGLYRFDKYRGNDGKKPNPVKELILCTGGKASKNGKAKPAKGPATALSRARVIADAVARARDYVNEPAAVMTPVRMGEVAKELAKNNPQLTVKVLGPKECEKLGMGMFLAVGRGSDEEPRLIHMTYTPKRKARRKVALIGKGVTFDSGGYSLKPSQAMEDMKIDMSGAAAVISAMAAIAELGSAYEVHAVAACCENLVSGRAYKLGDVLTAMDGTTVEINNTDAEGRLTLGDAITYARTKIEADEVLDFATLTGACVVALGPYTAGVFANDEGLARRWMEAADSAGEDMWRMPLHERLRDQLKSPIADMRNTGERYGGAITAGLFLKHFARTTPWLHVDLAGPASVTSDHGATPKGGTGFGVATIVEYLAR
jgi:leucyl aminopeptidase